MPNNTANLSNLDHAPAQRVGGMRVKEPHHRIPKEEEGAAAAAAMMEEGEQEQEENTMEQEEEERMRIRAMQERQAQDLQNHAASRQPDIAANRGNNVKQLYIPNAQPRSMNH